MEAKADTVRVVPDSCSTSGEHVMIGDEDTEAVYSVVVSGIEGSLNGEQEELIS